MTRIVLADSHIAFVNKNNEIFSTFIRIYQLYFHLIVADNVKAKLPAFVALVKDSHEHKNKTYYNTDLQYAEYKPFFWGKAAKYGESNLYKENYAWSYRFMSYLSPFFKSS